MNTPGTREHTQDPVHINSIDRRDGIERLTADAPSAWPQGGRMIHHNTSRRGSSQGFLISCLAAALSLCGACAGDIDPGATATIRSRPSVADSTTRNDLGDQIQIDEARIAITSIELEPCDASPSLLSSLSDLLGPATALAHATESSTRSAAPIFEDLLEPTLLVVFEPPARRYCAISYLVSARHQTADALLEGRSMYLSGTYQTQDNPTPTPFVFTSTKSFDQRLPVNLDLSGGEQQTITLQRDTSRWFHGVDLTLPPSMELSDRLLFSIIQSTTIEVTP